MWLKFFPYLEVTAQSLSVVMLIAGGLFVVFGRITMGQYAAFSGLIWTLSNPMRTLGNIVNDLQRFTASANKIIEIYYGSPRIVDRNDAVDKPPADLTAKSSSITSASLTTTQRCSRIFPLQWSPAKPS